MTDPTHHEALETAEAPSFASPKLAMWLFLGTEIMFFCGLFSSYFVLKAGATGGNPELWPTHAQTHIEPLIGLINTFILLASSVAMSLSLHHLQAGRPGPCRTALGAALILGLAFLGIKAWEYRGKIEHGLLPGRIAEDPGHDLRRERILSRGQRVWLDRQRAELEDYVAKTKESPDLAAAKEFLESLRDGKKSNGDYIRPLSPIEAAFKANELLSKHPHLPIVPALPNGNLWASFYFIMTGLHALHLIAGLVLIAICYLRGLTGNLSAQHPEFLENTALYWHFVDWVWLLLFPTIYLF